MSMEIRPTRDRDSPLAAVTFTDSIRLEDYARLGFRTD
jgi:hypothetical protein